MPQAHDSAAVPFGSLLDSVLERSELLGRSPDTDRRYRVVARNFAAWALGAAPHLVADIRTIRRADVERFILARRAAGLAWSTVRTEWNFLRALLTRAVRDERLDRVPQPDIRWQAKVAEDRRAGRSLEPGRRVLDVVPLLLDAAAELAYYRQLEPSLPALFRFLAYTGARSGEVLVRIHGDERLGMRWRDLEGLDTEQPIAVIRGGKGRALGARRVPVPAPAVEGLRGLGRGELEEFVWPWQTVGKSWGKVRAFAAERAPPELAAAVRAIRVHDLRHFASHYWRSLGVPDRLIDRLLGHRTPVIAARYAAADEREIGQACAAALRGADPPGGGLLADRFTAPIPPSWPELRVGERA